MTAGANCSTDRRLVAVDARIDRLRASMCANQARRGRTARLAGLNSPPNDPAMFVVTDADAAAIRAIFEQRGEMSAAVELRRRYPGITSQAQARECARTIAGWKPPRPVKRMPKPPRLRRVR
jgi:hypothetical protein